MEENEQAASESGRGQDAFAVPDRCTQLMRVLGVREVMMKRDEGKWSGLMKLCGVCAEVGLFSLKVEPDV